MQFAVDPVVTGDGAVRQLCPIAESFDLRVVTAHVKWAASIAAKETAWFRSTSGDIDGTKFDWIADADSRLGPVLEAVIDGKYYWIPFNRVAKVNISRPSDLRDLVWISATCPR